MHLDAVHLGQVALDLPDRSHGTSMRSGPSSVSTVLPLRPLRWLPLPPSLQSTANTARQEVVQAEARANRVAEAQALQAQNNAIRHTDERFAAAATRMALLDDRLTAVEGRVAVLDQRLSRMGAMTAAMAQMTASAAGIRKENRFAIGAGFHGGESALALGYQRAIGDRATISLGGSFTDEEESIGVGVGFGW